MGVVVRLGLLAALGPEMGLLGPFFGSKTGRGAFF